MPGSDRRAARGRRNPFGSILLGRPDESIRRLRVRVQVLLTALLVGTNVVGAGVVFLTSAFVVPAREATRATVVSLAIAVPVYVGVAVIAGATIGTATTVRALRWAVRGLEPDEADRDRALRVPLRLTQMQFVLWLGGTVLFTVLALVLQPDRALSTALTVGIATVVVCAVAYLLTQFAMRPVAARALAARPLSSRLRGAGVGDRMVIFWAVGTGTPLLGLLVVSIVTLADPQITRARLAIIVLVVAGIVLLFGATITVLNARSVVAPVLSVRYALLDVENGHLDVEVPVYDGTELGLLQSGFNRMVAGLREREHLRDLFGRHVGREVAQAAVAGAVELGGETRTASVLFVDLVGSTGYATRHSPQQVVSVLNRFFGIVVDEVDRQDGLVNKFMGDAVLAVFGAPVKHAEPATAALRAARAMAELLAAEVPEVRAGIGIATGEVVAGNVGHHERFEYTVIGDAVNCAARLTDLAKEVPGGVLADRATLDAADPAETRHWLDGDDVVLRGRSAPTATSRLRG